MSKAWISECYIHEAQEWAIRSRVNRKTTAILGSSGVEHEKPFWGTQYVLTEMIYAVVEEMAQLAQCLPHNP